MTDITREELTTIPNFKLNNLILEDISTLSTVNGIMTRSLIRTKYIDHNPGILLLAFPKQFCFGLSKKYAFGKDRTPENWTGDYQVCYSATSNKTIEQHTPEEQSVFDLCNTLEEELANYIFENKETLGGLYEKVATSAEAARNLVKPILYVPKKDEGDGKKMKKVVNKEKPCTLYIDVLRSKKTNTFKSRLFGPGDVEIKPLSKIEDVMGNIEPVIFFSHIHFDPKGTASFKLKLWEGNFTQSESFGPRRRLIGKNTDLAPQESASHESDDDEMKAMTRAVKSNPILNEKSDPVADLGDCSD